MYIHIHVCVIILLLGPVGYDVAALHSVSLPWDFIAVSNIVPKAYPRRQEAHQCSRRRLATPAVSNMCWPGQGLMHEASVGPHTVDAETLPNLSTANYLVNC
jgi:hypothetical protein